VHAHTIRGYIRTIRDFAAYFHKSPDQPGVEQVRQFQLHRLRDQKLAAATVQNRMTALRFFFKTDQIFESEATSS
jgi:site-specific recombinase XerD